jgi:hypothetical protein
VNHRRGLAQRTEAWIVLAGALVLSIAAGCGGVETQVEPEPTCRLVRCGYETDGGLHYLDVDFDLEHPSGALERIQQALEKAERAPRKARTLDQESAQERMRPDNTDGAPVRTLEIAVENGPFASVVVEDPGGPSGKIVLFLSAERRQAKGVLVEVAFLHWLRLLAQRAVLASMSPPRQALQWHYVALADFLSLQQRPYVQAPIFTEYLAEAADPRAVARALYPSVAGFSEHLLAPFATSDHLALRLLPLVRLAALGRREALREILTLSLEYHGELVVFDSAVRALFPQVLNADLYREYPESGGSTAAAAFLQHVGAHLDTAKCRLGRGYVLERALP